MKTIEKLLEETLNRSLEESEVTDLTFDMIKQIAKNYAQQFIDCAEEIIWPALDILPPTYQDDIDIWYEAIPINKTN